MILIQAVEKSLQSKHSSVTNDPFIDFSVNLAEFVELDAAAVVRVMLYEQLIADFI